jgi:hypothetical protein
MDSITWSNVLSLKGHYFGLRSMRLHNVTNLNNALPGNSFVNTNTGNNREENVFFAVRAEQKHGAMGSLFPGNAAVNMHPQQWKTVFSVGSVQKELS